MYTLTDAIGGIKANQSRFTILVYSWKLLLPVLSDPVGTWTVDESIDLGPYGGVKTGSSSFGVYTNSEHPLTNDLVTSATHDSRGCR